jgi:WD40 repeat protein/serine/threonine protein kinase
MVEDRLNSLLSTWQQQQRGGRDVPAAELCHDCPELAAELSRRIGVLRRMNDLLQPGGAVPGPPPPDTPADPVRRNLQAGFASAAAETLPPPAESWPASFASVGSVPGYEVLGELGRGGMGVVYKARHKELKRTVALKMVLAGAHASAEEVGRFRTEAEAAARLQHPQIVQIYEVGEHQGLPYFCLEYCDGGSLGDRLRGRTLTPTEAAAAVETVARAMHFAHQRGVIHRDLKPGNILLASDPTSCSPSYPPRGGDEGRTKNSGAAHPHPSLVASESGEAPILAGWVLKVTDFGLAKKIDASRAQTSSGAIMGTPGYMAPEQAEGRSKQVGPEADVYALGAVLYECLAGRPPFRAASTVETILQVIRDEPVPPSRLQPAVPRQLDTVTLKCLAKDPRKRYPSALALAEDLRQFRSGMRVTARPPSLAERTVKWTRRHPTLAALLCVLLLAGLAGLAGLYQFVTRLRTEKDRAEANERAARRVLYTAQLNLAQNAFHHGHTYTVLSLLEEQKPAPGAEDLRGWEWHYLRGQCDRALRTLSEHKESVNCIGYSPDGTRLARGAEAGKVEVWDARAGTEMLRLQHVKPIRAVAYSPVASRLAASGGAGAIKVWDATTGRELLQFQHSKEVVSLAYSPDGKRLAGGEWEGGITIWDSGTGRKVAEWKGHDDTTWSVKFSPDGTRLASGGADNTVRVWDASTGRTIWTLKGHTGRVLDVAYSPDGSRLASAGGEDKTVREWDTTEGRELLRLERGKSDLHSVAFGPDGSRLAAGGEDGVVCIWDARTGRALTNFRGHVNTVTGLAFSPDGARLASAGADGTVRIWDAHSHSESLDIQAVPDGGHDVTVNSVAFDTDGETLATGGSDHVVRSWDVRTGYPIASMTGHEDEVSSLAYSPVGTRLASAGWDNTVRIWDAATGSAQLNLRGHTDQVWTVAFSPDGARLASAGFDKTVRLWDATSARELLTFEGSAEVVNQVVFSPDGTRLAGAGGFGPVRVWDASTGRELQKLDGPQASTVAYSPDGSWLASSGGGDAKVRVWDARTGQPVFTLSGHGSPVRCLAFHPDGTRLASGGHDQTVRLWDLRTGREVLSLDYGNVVYCLAFSPDGTRLAVGGTGGTLQLYDGRPPDEAMRAEREAVSRLNDLFHQPLLKDEIRGRLPHDPFLDDPARRAALELLKRYHDDPEVWEQAARRLVLPPGAPAAQYRRGLELAEVACRLAPNRHDCVNVLGIAQFRLGRYEHALQTLDRSRQVSPVASQAPSPDDIGFLAMTRHHLGQHAEALAQLDALKKLLETEDWAGRDEAQALLREADQLIRQGPPKTGKN